MRRILRRREIVADEWHYLGEEVASDVSSTALIVPFTQLRTDPERWRQYSGRLGVRLSPADAVEDLAPELPRLEVIAAEFPGPGDGRGFSQGRILRTRLGYGGELRAVGAGVKQDLIFLMARSGFDSFDLAPGQSFDAAIAALERYSVAYQPGAPLASVRQQRYHAPG